MKNWLLVFLLAAASVTPLYFLVLRDEQRLVEAQRLEQIEKDLAQAQAEIGELKQQLMIVLKRDQPDD